MNERTLQALILETAGYTRWDAFHAYDSRRSAPGWPDLTLVGKTVLFRELKRDTQLHRVTPDQKVWLARLRLAGANADVWTPEDWPDRITAELQGRFVTARPLRWTLEEALAEQQAARIKAERAKLAGRVKLG